MLGHVAAAAALLLAQASPQNCITRQEAGDLALFVLPELITAASRQCASHLPGTAFLRTGADAFAQRLRGEAAGRRASAMAAFQRMAGNRVPQGVSPEVGLQAMASGMTAGIVNGLNARTCPEASGVLEALAPLPPANFAQLVSSGLGIAAANAREGGGLPICRT